MTKINQEEYDLLKSLDNKHKWIIRDRWNGMVYAIENEPIKRPVETGHSKLLNLDFKILPRHTTEYFNVSELIEEYEEHEFVKINQDGRERLDKLYGNKSEETEVKKDIEWLKEKVQKRIDKLPRTYSGLYIDGSRDAYHLALKDIDQLDEPDEREQLEIAYKDILSRREFLFDDKEYKVVPKQEITFEKAYDKLREESILSEKSFDYYWNCINDNVEIDEPGNLLVPRKELPVIPKFVAEWIEKYIEYGYDLYPALKKMENNSRSWEKTYDWYRKNTHTFVNAYLTGKYEVEEEQKYIVSDNSSIPLLIKNDSGEVMSYDSQIAYNNSNGTIELTEQEIKDYDPRYMTFAKPVEEVD